MMKVDGRVEKRVVVSMKPGTGETGSGFQLQRELTLFAYDRRADTIAGRRRNG
jgi:hypothetical protein